MRIAKETQSAAACAFDDCPPMRITGSRFKHFTVDAPGVMGVRFTGDTEALTAALDRIRQRALLDIESLRQRVSLIPYALVLAALLALAFSAGWFAHSALSPNDTPASAVGSGTGVTADPRMFVGDNAVRASLARGLSLDLPAALPLIAVVAPMTPGAARTNKSKEQQP